MASKLFGECKFSSSRIGRLRHRQQQIQQQPVLQELQNTREVCHMSGQKQLSLRPQFAPVIMQWVMAQPFRI
jgi:hypothetical protein